MMEVDFRKSVFSDSSFCRSCLRQGFEEVSLVLKSNLRIKVNVKQPNLQAELPIPNDPFIPGCEAPGRAVRAAFAANTDYKKNEPVALLGYKGLWHVVSARGRSEFCLLSAYLNQAQTQPINS